MPPLIRSSCSHLEERQLWIRRFLAKGGTMSPKSFLPARSIGGELRAYGHRLSTWVAGLLTRYVVAVVLLLTAFTSLLGAVGVGLGALFRFLETKYGTWIAFGSIGGLLLLLALVSAGLGIAKLKAAMPPPPSPRQHAKTASRIATTEAVGALTSSGKVLSPRPVVPAAIGLVSLGLFGWFIASRLNVSGSRSEYR